VNDDKIAISIMILVFVLGFIIGGAIGNCGGYKEGQINAINGKIEYTLQTNIDKTVEWVKKEKP